MASGAMGSDRGSLVSWEASECFPSTLTLLTLAWERSFFPEFSRRAGSGSGSLCGTQQQTQQGSVVLEDRARKSGATARGSLAGEGQK